MAKIDDETVALRASVEDLKLVYRVLHGHLAEHVELMENTFFEELQTRLQARAKADGVDVTDHAQWDAWLGNVGAPTCEERLEGRSQLGGPKAPLPPRRPN